MDYPDFDERDIGDTQPDTLLLDLAESVTFREVKSLVDLAAETVGRTLSCQDIDVQQCEIQRKHQAPSQTLDEGLWKKITVNAFPQHEKYVKPHVALATGDISKLWSKAERLLSGDKLLSMTVTGFIARAEFTSPKANQIQVQLTFQKQEIVQASCSDCKKKRWCEHILATTLYHIRQPDKVTRYAPLANVLSGLSKPQLQRLLQSVLGNNVNHLDTCMALIGRFPQDAAEGAPDMTEGYVEMKQRLSERGKKEFLQSLLTGDKRGQRLSLSHIRTGGYNWEKKQQSDFHLSISKILAFIKVGNFTQTMHLFTATLWELQKQFTSKGGANSISECRDIAHTMYDLSHLVAVCLIHPEIPREIAEKMRAEMREIQRYIPCTGREFYSMWTELPHLVQGCPDIQISHQFTASGVDHASQLFGHVSATVFVPGWPVELYDLVTGRVSWRHSDYNENLVLMLWRAESLLVTEADENHDKVLRMLPLLLRKLAILAQKFSVIGHKVKPSSWQQIFDTGYNIPALLVNSYSPGTTIKRRKLTHVQEVCLEKFEVAYSLLYCLYIKETCEKSTGKQFEGFETAVAFYWLALDISRFRICEHLRGDSKHELLCILEERAQKNLIAYYSQAKVKCTDCIYWYLSKLNSDVEIFSCLPLQLLSTLMYIVIQHKLHQIHECQKGNVFRICYITLMKCADLLHSLPQVVKTQMTISAIIKAFFDCVDQADSRYLSKTLESLTTICNRCSEVCNPEETLGAFQMAKIAKTKDERLAKAIFYFAVTLYKHHKKDGTILQSYALKIISQYAPVLGLQCIHAIIDHTGSVSAFSSTHIAQILLCMKKSLNLDAGSAIPDAFIQAMRYCFLHTQDGTSLENLLALYAYPCFTFEQFLDTMEILMEKQQQIPSKVFFDGAQLFEKLRKGKEEELCAYFDCLDQPCLTVIDIMAKGFEMLGKEKMFGSDLESRLRWVYRFCTQDGILESKVFVKLVKLVKKHGNSHAKVIALFLEVIGENKHYIGESNKAVLSEKYLEAVKSDVSNLISSSRNSKYGKIVEDIQNAVKLVGNLGIDNKENIKSMLQSLRSDSKKKWKLSKMLQKCIDAL